ncbi:DUF5947 family protein [Salinactinospora qingdaonensis]|uniref:DUF5947 family protein n=1 Tax=Salinactinospora qingdaonensis TaxID=702744 RepID=A0ABP7FAX3_9ACTN
MSGADTPVSAQRSPAGATSPAGLRRFLEPKAAPVPGERCEMCAEPLGEHHSHIADLDKRSVMCACRGCYLLFTSEGAAGGRYRAVPERCRYDLAFPISQAQWEELQIPVGIAFFFHNSKQGRMVTCYPSPAGATESLLPLAAAEGLRTANPAFADLAADVEALLLRRHDDGFHCFLVPIDLCYELVGLIRLHWKGFDGGQEVWNAIDAFFARLRDRGRNVGADRHTDSG